MHIYSTLGVDKWGSVGVDDLLDPQIGWDEQSYYSISDGNTSLLYLIIITNEVTL